MDQTKEKAAAVGCLAVAGLACYGLIRLAIWAVFSVASLINGEPSPPPAPPPPAKPVILEYGLQPLVFDDNQLAVSVRNDGLSGWVMLSYFTYEPVKKREAGAKTLLKNYFTDEGSPGYTVEHQFKGAWFFYTWLDAGQTKVLPLKLSGHSRWDEQGKPTAVGVDKPPDGAIIK
jgi:hypothetical protein